jgi:hypothetical protein
MLLRKDDVDNVTPFKMCVEWPYGIPCMEICRSLQEAFTTPMAPRDCIFLSFWTYRSDVEAMLPNGKYYILVILKYV